MILEQSAIEFLDQLSSGTPTPGGGGAAATVGAFAAALGMMVTNLTIGKKKYAEYEEEICEIKGKLARLQRKLVQLTDEDAEAFKPLAAAYRLPQDTQAQQREKQKVMEESLCMASEVPLEIMKMVLETMYLLEVLGEKGSRLAVSDVGVAILFGQAALEGASLNVFINTKMMKNKQKAKEMNECAEHLIQKGRELKNVVYDEVLEKVK